MLFTTAVFLAFLPPALAACLLPVRVLPGLSLHAAAQALPGAQP